MNQIRRKQTNDGKAIAIRQPDIAEMVLSWLFIALITATVTTVWFDGGPVLGILASAMGAIIAWRVL